MNFSKEQIARLCHEVNKSYCELIGDYSQKSWDDSPEWQKESAIKGVEYKLNNLDITPEDQHKGWCDHKTSEGWVYGETKDEVKKTHPCLVPYTDLPSEQKVKDYLFASVITSLL